MRIAFRSDRRSAKVAVEREKAALAVKLATQANNNGDNRRGEQDLRKVPRLHPAT
jgi:hypothetical protein